VRKTGLIILAALLLAGCGDEEKQVRATLAADRKAGERRDWDAMCALRTEAGRRELAFCVAEPPNESGTETTVGNEPIVTFSFKSPPLRELEVDGDQATARFDGGPTQRLRKVDDRWLIDGAGDEEQIRATLAAYDRAFARGDHAAACALMTEPAQRELLYNDPSGCGATASPERGEFGVSQAELVREVLGDLQRIEIDGDTAEARYDRSVTTLRKVDGRWLIDAGG
jgi:hypothetical protein